MTELNIRYQKSCRGIFYSYDEKQIIDVRDYFRDDILDSLKRSEISHSKRVSNDKTVYYAKIPNTKVYVRDIRWDNSSEGYDEIKHLLSGMRLPHHQYVCPVSSANYDLLEKSNELPEYYNKIIAGQASEIAYLDSINGDMFHYEDNTYIILPDMIKYPITQNDVEKVKNANGIENIYSLLYNYHFNLFIRNTNIRTVFDVSAKLLNDIKKTIIEYYNRFFNFEDITQLDQNRLNININTDTKYHFITIEFNLFDNYESYKQFSFIQNYKLIRLDDVLRLLESEIDAKDLVYYIRFHLKDNRTPIFCEGKNALYDTADKCLMHDNFNDCKKNKCFWNNIHRRCETFTDDSKELIKKTDKCKKMEESKCLNDPDCYYNEKNNRCYLNTKKIKEKRYTLSKKVNLDDLDVFKGSNPFEGFDQVINEYGDAGQEETVFCKDFVILQKDDEYYHVSLKSITYDMLISDDKIKQEYQEALLKIIDNRELSYSYDSGNVTYNYYIANMVAYAEITMTKLNDYRPKISAYFLEPADTYRNKILPLIKNVLIDNTIIITLIYFNMLRNKEDAKFIESQLQQNIFLRQFVNKLLDSSKNFIITSKSGKKLNPNYFVLWYCPSNLKIKDKEMFTELLNTINSNQVENNYYETYKHIRTNEKYQQIIKECTNFYDLYKKDNFVYNLRHLTNNHNKEIDDLITNFTKNKYKEDYKKYITKPFFSWLHYPNSKNFNVFHIKIASFQNFNSEDIMRRYTSSSDVRYYNWDIVKNYNYSDKEMNIGFFVDKQNKNIYLQKMLDLTLRNGVKRL